MPSLASPSVCPDPEHEPEVVPTPIVVRFIDAHAVREQADEEGKGSDHAVPKPTPEPSRVCVRLFVFGI